MIVNVPKTPVKAKNFKWDAKTWPKENVTNKKSEEEDKLNEDKFTLEVAIINSLNWFKI